MKKFYFLTITISVLILVFPSLNAFAQEAFPNNIQVGWYDGHSVYAELTPYNLEIIEKPRYNVIKFTVKVEIPDLAFDDSVFFKNHKTILINENSKKYIIDIGECASPLGHIINGKKTNTWEYVACYSVEKEFEKFDIMYDSITIGAVDSNKYNLSKKPVSNPVLEEKAEKSNGSIEEIRDESIFDRFFKWCLSLFNFNFLLNQFTILKILNS